MTDASELQRREEAFRSEAYADAFWDDMQTESVPNPHEPGRLFNELLALGEAVVPVLCRYARGPAPDLFSWGINGLRELGPQAGTEGLAALESLLSGRDGDAAAGALAAVNSERFFALGLHARLNVMRKLGAWHRARRTADVFLTRVLRTDDPAAVSATLEGIGAVRSEDHELVAVLRNAMMRVEPAIRGDAAAVLALVPGGSPPEALIEAMATAQRVSAVDRVAWHADSQVLIELLVLQEKTDVLAELLERRRCAGLLTRPESVRGLLEKKLRLRGFEHREALQTAARCALALPDVTLLPSLVELIAQDLPWNATQHAIATLRVLGAPALSALSALEVAAVHAEPARAERLRAARAVIQSPGPSLESADRAFIEGFIDGSEGERAFQKYGAALAVTRSAHAAFQLAWIDRAFGVPMTPARIGWIRSLGCRDASLLAELERPVVALEGRRSAWAKCSADDSGRVARAGLPGLAFLGSRAPRLRADAEAHVARVRSACAS